MRPLAGVGVFAWVGCTAPDAAEEAARGSAAEQVGPPAALVLPRAVAGHLATFEVREVAPGAAVWLVRGVGPGAGPCPPALGGACLGLRRPVLWASAVSDAAGVARLTVAVPATAPTGAGVWVQAATGVGDVTPPARLEVVEDGLAARSTSFDATSDLAAWQILSELEGAAARHDVIEVTGGALRVVPNAWDDPSLGDGGEGPGWFQDRKGPMVLQELDGDFAVRLRVTATTTAGGDPVAPFTSAGLLVRGVDSFDPARSPDVGDERWIMYNVGYQDGGLATELKSTFPDGADGDPRSQSSLYLDPVAEAAAELVLCRVGGEVRGWRRVAGEAEWTAEQPSPATQYLDGAGLGPDPLSTGFSLAGPVQVGFIVSRWTLGPGAPVVGLAEQLELGVPADLDDCLAAPVGPPA